MSALRFARRPTHRCTLASRLRSASLAALLAALAGCEAARESPAVRRGAPIAADTLRPVAVLDAAGHRPGSLAVLEGSAAEAHTAGDPAGGFALAAVAVDLAVRREASVATLRLIRLPDRAPIGGITLVDDEPRAPTAAALYRRADGAIFAIVAVERAPRLGTLRQYLVEEADVSHGLRATRVRDFGAFGGRGSIEAIAVDPQLGHVYYVDPGIGVRKYAADPAVSEEELALFGTTGFSGEPRGLTVYAQADGTGYLLVSEPGAARLHVYPRGGTADDPHAHPALAILPISIPADGDPADGAGLGDGAGGLLVAAESGSLHLYRWSDVEAAIASAKEQQAK